LTISCLGKTPLDTLDSFNNNHKPDSLTVYHDDCFCCINHEFCTFQGGEYETFINYLSSRIDSFKTNIKSDRYTGLLIQFDVDKHGKVTNIDLLKETENNNLNTKIVQILSESNGWTPAKALGYNIMTRFILIVEICNYKIKISMY